MRIQAAQRNISVIIPALNEEAIIGDVVTSILAENWGESIVDVIVVDNGSTDNILAQNLHLKSSTGDSCLKSHTNHKPNS